MNKRIVKKQLKKKIERLEKENRMMQSIINASPSLSDMYDRVRLPRVVYSEDVYFQKLQARIILPSWYSGASEAEKARIMASYKRALATKMVELLEPYIEYEATPGFGLEYGEILCGELYVGRKADT